MRKEMLRTDHTEVVLSIENTGKSFSLELDIEEELSNQEVYIWFENLAGQVIGEIRFGHFQFLPGFYISKEKTSLNAKPMILAKGDYLLRIFAPGLEIRQGSLTLTIAMYYDQEYETFIKRNAPLSEDSSIFLQETSIYDKKQSLAISDLKKKDGKKVKGKFYRGDFHGHTIASDGKADLGTALRAMEDEGLKMMAITEHNTLSQGTCESDLLQIPAAELTMLEGHVNVFGLEDGNQLSQKLYGLKAYDLGSVLETMSHLGVTSLNHMFMNPWHLSDPKLSFKHINLIEVICDPTYETGPEANKKAIDFLDFLWKKGLCVFGIGGSDNHNRPGEAYKNAIIPTRYGDPSTYVYGQELEVKEILKGIIEGHAYVSRFICLSFEILDSHQTAYIPGDQIHEKSLTYRVRMEFVNKDILEKICPNGLKGYFIINGQKVKEIQNIQEGIWYSYTTRSDTKVNSYEVDRENMWMRFGVDALKEDEEEDEVMVYVNPVYYGDYSRQDSSKTILEWIEEFEKA